MSRVLNLLLTHQTPKQVERMLARWQDCCPPENILIAFDGSEEDFARIPHAAKVRMDDARLRTSRHSRERQSYCSVFSGASGWLRDQPHTHVHFAEYDHVPLVPDLNERQLARLAAEQADVLAFELARVDGTNHPHYLYHLHLPGFASHWAAESVRPDGKAVLSMFGSGSFWTRAAFDAVAAQPEPFPIYLELYLPTTAHHLGYRLRDWAEQNRHVGSLGDFANALDAARADGAWTVHPVKTLWNR